MEKNDNHNLPPTMLCRMGCGFYGNPQFEGLCSKCYKDQLKRKNNSSPVSGRMTPPVSTSSSMSSAGETEKAVSSVTSTLAHASLGKTDSSSSESNSSTPTSETSNTTQSIETATPTVSVPSPTTPEKADKTEEGATGGADILDVTKSPEEDDKDKKPKKNRCHTCKKKVGLTGFPCRCGGLFCSIHRYSDKHECTFNYKEMAQEHIRKHNPVIVAEKIQKI